MIASVDINTADARKPPAPEPPCATRATLLARFYEFCDNCTGAITAIAMAPVNNPLAVSVSRWDK